MDTFKLLWFKWMRGLVAKLLIPGCRETGLVHLEYVRTCLPDGQKQMPKNPMLALSPIVGLRLGMDEDAKQVGNFLAEASFQRRLNVVHARQRQVVQHGAMQREVKPAANALEHEVVHVHDLGKARGHRLQALLESGRAHQTIAGF